MVSIPSRRVGDLGIPFGIPMGGLCFHPLKAGRRLVFVLSMVVCLPVFPSPQGGSETFIILPSSCRRVVFPSPQGGSETAFSASGLDAEKVFPSPQGGSETGYEPTVTTYSEKFPSPQGGSETELGAERIVGMMEFPSPQGGSETSEHRSYPVIPHVSIPSRRVGDNQFEHLQ